MTKQWKLKSNSFNILLVFIILFLVKAEWSSGSGQIQEGTNEVASNRYHSQIYVGNDEIASYFFSSSTSNGSSILEGIHKCLDSFQLITCMKMLLLSRIDDVISLMEEPDVARKDLHALYGMLTFKVKNTTANVPVKESHILNLDEEIADKVRRIFRGRSFLINLLPKMKIEIGPSPETPKGNFLCFQYEVHRDETTSGKFNEIEERKRKKGSGGMPMMMMIPQLIMLGLMPFTLASLKAMVMNAVMINMMALNGAIFMTIRNLVFGPRKGDNVKYVNYGYSKDRQTQSKRPVLIIHSPAAFVKQPPVHRHPFAPYKAQSHFSGGGSSHSYLHENPNSRNNYEDQPYLIQEEEEDFKHKSESKRSGNSEGIEKRNNPKRMEGDFYGTIEVSSLPKGGNLKTSNQLELLIQAKDILGHKLKVKSD